jgi:hypothetical protein
MSEQLGLRYGSGIGGSEYSRRPTRSDLLLGEFKKLAPLTGEFEAARDAGWRRTHGGAPLVDPALMDQLLKMFQEPMWPRDPATRFQFRRMNDAEPVERQIDRYQGESLDPPYYPRPLEHWSPGEILRFFLQDRYDLVPEMSDDRRGPRL